MLGGDYAGEAAELPSCRFQFFRLSVPADSLGRVEGQDGRADFCSGTGGRCVRVTSWPSGVDRALQSVHWFKEKILKQSPQCGKQ